MFEAKYDGRCPACETNIEIGEMVTMINSDRGRVVVHEECANVGEIHSEGRYMPNHVTDLPRGKTASDSCNKCFLVHAMNQEACE